jgi:cystathionine beta-lyase/cystathionine gamma-synthase
MKRAACISLALLFVAFTVVSVQAQDGVEEDVEKWGELAQFLMGHGLNLAPRHDWNDIDTEDGPFMRAHEALLSAKQGQESAVSPGITMSANFRFPKTLSSPASSDGTQYFYSRVNNPNFEMVERQLSAWYDVRHKSVPKYPNDMVAHIGLGVPLEPRIPSPKVVSFASGMGAIAAVLGSLVKSGDKIIIANELYYEVEDLGSLFASMGDIKMITMDVSQIDKVVDMAVDTSVKVLYLESASNPHGRVPDFDLLISRVRAVNSDIIVVVDNTWTTPVVFQPFRHDVDVIVESATKYLSGKGDAVFGIAAVYNHPPVLSTSDEEEHDVSEARRTILAELPQKLRVWRRLIGSNPSPMNAWLVSKGLETLQLRMEHLSIKTPEIADFISTLPPVTRVHYCGSPTHPHFQLSQKYFNNGYCAGVLSFHLPLKNEEEVLAFMKTAGPFVAAPSFGEANTLVMWPRKGSSRNFPEDEATGVPDIDGYWFRLSLGLAPSEEIKRDFFRWLTKQSSLIKHLASVDYTAFSRSDETGEIRLQLSKADWAQISVASQPLFLKRQELADIDASMPHRHHPIPITLKHVKDNGVSSVEISLETKHPERIASFVSPGSTYIIASFVTSRT